MFVKVAAEFTIAPVTSFLPDNKTKRFDHNHGRSCYDVTSSEYPNKLG